jgi:uncharacterized DUF497 family protein
MFEWDEDKRAINLAKHGIDFALASQFHWETALIGNDARQNYGEPRKWAIGYIGARLHMMIFTDRLDLRRVISLRRANTRERKHYVQETKA